MDKKKKLGVLEWFMVIMFAISVVCVILQVVSRKNPNVSLPWCNEVARYSFLWVVFIGSAVMLKENGHICIDFLLTVTSKKVHNVLLLINYCCVLILTALLALQGAKVVIATNGSLSSVLRLPINIILYLAFPIGMALGFCIMLGKVVHQVKVIVGKVEDEESEHLRKE